MIKQDQARLKAGRVEIRRLGGELRSCHLVAKNLYQTIDSLKKNQVTQQSTISGLGQKVKTLEARILELANELDVGGK